MPKILFFLLLALSGGAVFGQVPATTDTVAAAPGYRPPANIRGTWVGELYQDAGGIADKFELSMEIRQIGLSVKGTSYVKLNDIWAEMEFSGYEQANGTWKLSEFKVVRAEKPEALSWCMKRYNLTLEYTASGKVLSGPWWGNSEFGPCVPGSVRLRRKATKV